MSKQRKIVITTELSRRCNIRCPHCIVMASPRHHHKISMKNLYHIIDEVSAGKEYSHLINFTGGEPFLALDRLKKTLSYAHRAGVRIALVTNGFWAESLKKARAVLNELKNVYLINISWDYYHQRFIPLKYVINAANACLEKGVKVAIRGIHFGFTKKDAEKARLYYRKIIGPLDKRIRIVSIPFILGGHAEQIIDRLPVRLVTKVPNSRRCEKILRTIFISSYGEVYPCCCNLFCVKKTKNVILGNINETPLDNIIEKAKKGFLPNFILKYGIAELIKLISSIKGKDFTKKYYTDIQKDDQCQVCSRILDDDSIISLFGKMAGKKNSRWYN